ncbi:YidB family protein [Catenulispora sp. MAP12-49]|uniref:YidB family protein n=1 Tax=Catenulispora sp. MAP12-49 TaxID=3156302 RepID=UPI0035149B09
MGRHFLCYATTLESDSAGCETTAGTHADAFHVNRVGRRGRSFVWTNRRQGNLARPQAHVDAGAFAGQRGPTRRIRPAAPSLGWLSAQACRAVLSQARAGALTESRGVMSEMGQQSGIGKTINQVKKTVGGDIGGMFNKLKNSSISEQFQSWIGKGENKPVTPEQVTQALGNEQLAKIADQTGVTPEQAAQNISQKLPTLVDKMTPDGQLPDQPVLSGMAAGGGNAASKAGVGDRRSSM